MKRNNRHCSAVRGNRNKKGQHVVHPRVSSSLRESATKIPIACLNSHRNQKILSVTIEKKRRKKKKNYVILRDIINNASAARSECRPRLFQFRDAREYHVDYGVLNKIQRSREIVVRETGSAGRTITCVLHARVKTGFIRREMRPGII